MTEDIEVAEDVVEEIEVAEEAELAEEAEDAIEEELYEIEVDEDLIEAYIVDEDDNEIGFIILNEDGEEEEYYYADDDADAAREQGPAVSHAASNRVIDNVNEYDLGITREGVAEATNDLNAIYKDGIEIAAEFKGAFDDIAEGFSFLKKK